MTYTEDVANGFLQVVRVALEECFLGDEALLALADGGLTSNHVVVGARDGRHYVFCLAAGYSGCEEAKEGPCQRMSLLRGVMSRGEKKTHSVPRRA